MGAISTLTNKEISIEIPQVHLMHNSFHQFGRPAKNEKGLFFSLEGESCLEGGKTLQARMKKGFEK